MNESNVVAQVTHNVLAREQNFTFKKIAKEKLELLLVNGFDDDLQRAAARAKFEILEGDELGFVKRKPELVKFELPSFCAGMDEMAQDILASYVAQYIKANFIDDFLPVGAHDWETIKVAAAATGGRAVKFDISDEIMASACASIGAFVGNGTNNSEVGKKFQAACEGKLSRTAIQRNIGAFTADLIGKIEVWLTKWAENVAMHEEDSAEDFGAVFEMLSSKLEKHMKAETVNVAELL